MRTLVIGDVHGCSEELDALLDVLGFSPADGDRLVLVGDLVAKGPDSAGVVARARRLGALAVRGNHDEHVLRWWRAREAGQPLPELGPSHRAVCRQLDAEDWSYLDSLPTMLRFDDALAGREVIVVHAALDPARPLDMQREEDLLNGRSMRADGSISKRVDEGVPWASRWPGPALVVFGHDAIRKLQRHPHAIGLDTGCVYGGSLSGVVLDGDEVRVLSLPARRVHCAPKGAA